MMMLISKSVMRHKFKLMLGLVGVLIIGHLVTSNGGYYGAEPVVTHGDGKGSNIVIDPTDFGKVSPSLPSGVPAVKPPVGDTVVDGGQKAAGESSQEDNGSQGVNEAVLKSIRDYRAFFNGMDEFAIKSPSIKDKYRDGKAAEKFAGNDDFLFSKEYLENVLVIPDSTFEELKRSHTGYVEKQMKKLLEDYKLSTFGNILESDGQWKDYKDSKGYVLIGGGRYSWLSFLVIKQIRAIGSTLPIELFIPSSMEYESKFCEEVLPGYNARCNVFEDEFTAELSENFGIGGYQYKMLALLSSKFENVIYLDSDNFPVRNPEFILESTLYKERGLMLWPDAWARTTNPKFYDIANVNVKENKVRYSKYDDKHGGRKPLNEYTYENSRYHDFEGTLPDPTSETGMLIVNKTKHLKTLLLSLYYNVYGPHFYYPLMTQGSAGEGDKESFIAAAHVLGEPWFQTLKGFRWCGYVSESDNKFTSKALGHYDPIQSETDPDGDLDIIFMHLSYPKYYPNWLADNHDLIYADSGNHIRMYGDVYKSAGYDFDLRVLQFFTQALCQDYYDEKGMSIDGAGLHQKDEYMGHFLKYIIDEEKNNKKRCAEVFLPHLKWLKETTEYPNSVVQPQKHDDY